MVNWQRLPAILQILHSFQSGRSKGFPYIRMVISLAFKIRLSEYIN